MGQSYLKGKGNLLRGPNSRMMSKNFQFPFSIGQNMLVIEQNGDYFDLRINNIDFDDINESGIFSKN